MTLTTLSFWISVQVLFSWTLSKNVRHPCQPF